MHALTFLTKSSFEVVFFTLLRLLIEILCLPDKKSAAVTFFVRKIYALAFASPRDISWAFKTLCEESRADFKELRLWDYIRDMYAGPYAYYPVQFWNVYQTVKERLPTTNNSVEGWSNQLNSCLSCHHPGFYKFLEIIKKEQQATKNMALERLSGIKNKVMLGMITAFILQLAVTKTNPKPRSSNLIHVESV